MLFRSLMYMISTILTGYISYIMPKRLFILFSFVSLAIGLFLMGPSSILGLPNYIWLFLIGLGLTDAARDVEKAVAADLAARGDKKRGTTEIGAALVALVK